MVATKRLSLILELLLQPINLREEVKNGQFREDLFYRLDVLPLHWPPLRERSEDILPISQFFINKYQDGSRCHLSHDARTALCQYNWPGNIRELENVIQRALVMRHGDYITAQDLMLPMELLSSAQERFCMGHVEIKSRRFQYILEQLRHFGKPHKTANALGVTTRALR